MWRLVLCVLVGFQTGCTRYRAELRRPDRVSAVPASTRANVRRDDAGRLVLEQRCGWRHPTLEVAPIVEGGRFIAGDSVAIGEGVVVMKLPDCEVATPSFAPATAAVVTIPREDVVRVSQRQRASAGVGVLLGVGAILLAGGAALTLRSDDTTRRWALGLPLLGLSLGTAAGSLWHILVPKGWTTVHE